MRQNKGRLTFGQQLFAGAVAGISEIIVMYPLDVVKTRIQLQVGGNSPGFAMMLVDITKKEGILRLYRGIQAPILIEAPKRAIKFAANDQYTRFLWPHFQEYHILSYLPVTAGMLAGATEALAVVSMELVKVRMQDQLRVNEYRNFMHCIESIVRHEGVFALFKGLEATAWRHVVWNGGYFGSIPHFKQYLARFKVENEELCNFMAGTAAGTVGTILNTPFDVAKSRLQNTKGASPWTLPTLAQVHRLEGARALYKGFVPKVLRLGPGGGILFLVYNKISSIFLSSA